jgi:hypothetical protein
MFAYNAAPWSHSINKRKRRSHLNWTKQRAREEMASWSIEEVEVRIAWTWQEVLERYESLQGKQRSINDDSGGRNHDTSTRGGHTGWLAEPGFRPEPTPRTFFKENVTIQAPCYVVIRTVSSEHSQPGALGDSSPHFSCENEHPARMSCAGSALLVSSTPPRSRISCAGSTHRVASEPSQPTAFCASAPH